MLGAAHLVAGDQHRHARRQQERGQQIAQLAVAQCGDVRVVGLALGTAVPGPVVVGAVAVALAVVRVALVLVGDQVAEREAVVRGDEVDRGVRAAAAPGVQVARSGEAVAQVADIVLGTAPEVADGVAVAVVPLRPQRREGADLVAARSHVPGLGDQLDPAQHRVLGDHREERGEHVDVVHGAGQCGRQIEAEAVHAHLGDPVAQRIGDQTQDMGLDDMQGVAAAGVVGVAAGLVRQAVVAAVVDAPQGGRRAQLMRPPRCGCRRRRGSPRCPRRAAPAPSA